MSIVWRAVWVRSMGFFLGIVLACASLRASSTYIVRDLGVLPGGNFAVATGINNRGDAVGYAYYATGDMHAVMYSGGEVHDLGLLPGSSATAINDNGQIAGVSGGGGAAHGFLLDSGGMTPLGTWPGGFSSAATAINNAGQITGHADTATSSHAFRYDSGVMLDLGTLPGGSYSDGLGINDGGQVVGYADAANGRAHAFLHDGIMRDLGVLSGGVGSLAFAVNDAVQVVGTSDVGGGSQHAFLYADGAMTDLGTISGRSNSAAYSINEYGWIVGHSYTNASDRHAFVYDGISISDLNDATMNGTGWVLTDALGINDAGQIVGYGSFNGRTRAFLLDPVSVPLPSAVWGGLGLSVIIAGCRWGRRLRGVNA